MPRPWPASRSPAWEHEALRVAALLYDVGEFAVPEHIILKPGKLSVEEFDKVKIHTLVGAEMLEKVSFPSGGAARTFAP